MMRIFGFFLTTAVVFLVLLGISSALMAQSKISNFSQVAGNAPVTVEWGICTGSGTTPDGRHWDCNGLEVMRFRYKNGSTKTMALAPSSPEIDANTKFVKVPLN